MADKIDNINGYDIDLPPDATPSIKSLTVIDGSGTNRGSCSISVDTSGADATASISFGNLGIVGYTKIDGSGITINSPLLGTYTLSYPSLTANAIIATQSWVEGKGYTTNQGTVTSVGAGTGLSISGTASVNPAVNIASGYKLPTTTEWNSKSSVSGVNDGTNWTSITINGVTKNIPSGGSGSLTLDNVSDGTTRKLNQVTAATGKAKLGVKTVGVKPHQSGDGYLELSDSSVSQGTTTYYRDRIVYGSNTLTFPTRAGVLALVGDIKHLYKHWVIFNVYSDIFFKFEFYSTSTTSSSTLTAANLLQMLQGKIVGAVNNNSGSSVMLSVHQAIQANTYQGFIYYVGGSYVEFYPFAVNVTYVTIEDSGYEEV